LSFAARLSAAVIEAHPRVIPVIHAASASEIAAGLATRRFDLGISYTEEDGLPGAAPFSALAPPRPLYRERYVLRAPQGMVGEGRQEISWAEAASLPLALLTPDMKNRQIIDAAFRRAGALPRPVFETNSISTLYAFLGHAGVATIAPASAAAPDDEEPGDVALLALTEPELGRTVAALLPDARFVPPASAAVLAVAEAVAGALPSPQAVPVVQ
ncbi:MAG: LysR family transcriptional regulator substrate-binding protein, partial [Pseudomonadota bacterium]